MAREKLACNLKRQFFLPLLNNGITLAIFILDGNTPVLNEILQICARGLQITDTTFAAVSMLISSTSELLIDKSKMSAS